MPLEKHIEARFAKYVEDDGRWTIKLNAFGVRGIPDRLVLLGHGRVCFIEFKRPGQRARKLQQYIHEKLRRLGYAVQTCDNFRAAQAFYEAEKAEAEKGV